MSDHRFFGGSELIHDSVMALSRSTTPIPAATGTSIERDLTYNFINTDFLDHHHHPTFSSPKSFRNLTHTPTDSSYPFSLPKSLPIDWDLFNEQYRLQQKLERFRARKRRRLQATSQKKEHDVINDIPFEIFSFIVQSIDDQNDLISLSRTCKKFNMFVNRLLYQKIAIVDSFEGSFKDLQGPINVVQTGYTVLNLKRYPKFLATLHSNDGQIQWIKQLVIATSTPDLVNENENVYQPLYDLFMTRDNNLKSFHNFDLKNLKKFGSILKYNKDHLIKYNFKQYKFTNLIEDEDIDFENVNVEELIEKDLLNLQNATVLSLNELTTLPQSVTDLVISVENQYTLAKEQFQMTQRLFNKFANLKSLYLVNTLSLRKLTDELLSISPQPWFNKLQLETLSITNIHKNYMVPPVSFEQLNTIIDVPKVVNLEIKLNCLARNVCGHCIVDFFSQWADSLLTADSCSKLKKLSLIELQSPLTGEASLINNQWSNLFLNYADKLAVIFATVEDLTLSLDDYPLIPCLETLHTSNIARKVFVTPEIVRTRSRMFDSLIQCLNSDVLKVLNIPDFLINWLPYNGNSNGDAKAWFDHDGIFNIFDSTHKLSNILNRYCLMQPPERHNFNELVLKQWSSKVNIVSQLSTTLNPLSNVFPQSNNDQQNLTFDNQIITNEDIESLQKCVFHNIHKKGVFEKWVGNVEVQLKLGGMGRFKLSHLQQSGNMKFFQVESLDWKIPVTTKVYATTV
ncbi:hypothetical protein WICPIJ_001551 [Wickerhamomyces pijperi]|uniref:F-box domain-containing protein n=1 Tax=Wickerhamomyces pijperi TaxID=599730 RepID=A0A9P8TR03_WICPI|nr:hypothetical protein WICPIJ_001551 [Wickerhamomyces pijperi]